MCLFLGVKSRIKYILLPNTNIDLQTSLNRFIFNFGKVRMLKPKGKHGIIPT